MFQQAVQTASVAALPRSSSVVLQAMFAIVFGAFIVGMAGFSHIEAIHNAAHDIRHSSAFPCH
jgi:cobalt transporter subunit CbtB